MIKDYNAFINNSKHNLENMINTLSCVKDVNLREFNPQKTVLTIIDMNNGFARVGALYSPRVEEIIPNIESLTEACVDKKIDVVALSDYHVDESPELDSYPTHCMEGTQEVELVDELKRIKEIEVINKNSTNGFFKMLPKIEKGQYDTFIVTGCVTDICVYQFVITLKAYFNEYNLDVRIVVPLDCVETFDIPNVHDAEFMNVIYLNSLISNGIEVVRKIQL